MLDAVNADVVMLEEVVPLWTVDNIRRRFPRFRQSGWDVRTSASQPRRLIAVRGRIDDELGPIPYSAPTLDALLRFDTASDRSPSRVDSERHGAGASGFVVTIGQRRLLAVPVELPCCGGPGTEQELWRLADVEAIRRAVTRVTGARTVDGVIVGGDFNLVGSRTPLDLMARGLDPDGSDLAVVPALSFDGSNGDTWRQANGRFPPGRLDWMLHSASTLELLRAFVFDTAALTPAWLAVHGLRTDDSALASDHLPVVADLRWR
jgi:hypothetical protein